MAVFRGLVRVDLAKLGARDTLLSAVHERIGALSTVAKNLMNAEADGLATRLVIMGAQCQEGALQIELQYRSGSGRA